MKIDDGQRCPSVNLENDWSGVNKNFNIDRRGLCTTWHSKQVKICIISIRISLRIWWGCRTNKMINVHRFYTGGCWMFLWEASFWNMSLFWTLVACSALKLTTMRRMGTSATMASYLLGLDWLVLITLAIPMPVVALLGRVRLEFVWHCKTCSDFRALAPSFVWLIEIARVTAL